MGLTTHDESESYWRMLRRTVQLIADELPTAILVNVLVVVLVTPTGIAVASASPWWIVAISTIPICIYSTGIAAFARLVMEGARARLRDALKLDVVAGGVLAASVVVSFALVNGPGAFRILGCFVIAIILMTAPLAIASSASVEKHVGIRAWRAGVLLAAFRPSAAISLAAMSVLALSAIVISAGALALALPSTVAVFEGQTVQNILKAARGGIDQVEGVG